MSSVKLPWRKDAGELEVHHWQNLYYPLARPSSKPSSCAQCSRLNHDAAWMNYNFMLPALELLFLSGMKYCQWEAKKLIY